MIRIQFKTNLQDAINILKDQWIWFIDDQIEVIEGKRNHFYGKMHNSSMIDNEEAEKRLAEWQNLQRFKIRN
ncbi:MAG: general stress protein CsbD [Methylococcaceae bacterium]|nr:general stress protein CsbD [Methylococcaceae bacterium]